MNKLTLILIVSLLLVSTGIGEAIDGPGIKKNKDFSPIKDDNNRINPPQITINSPLDGYEYFTSNLLINISAWSEDEECFSYECESYEIEECLDDPGGFGNCFIDDGGYCDTYECWDIGDLDECQLTEDCFWNETNGGCNYPYNCWNFNESDCSIDNQYNLTCYWDDDSGCDDLECDSFVNETSCQNNPYEMDCQWKFEELENVWYNINYGENFSYLGEIFYSFEDGENILTACANNSDGLTGCDYSEFNVSNIQCGSIITEDTTLTEDILNCDENGLIIGVSDITLDCDGYSVEGNYSYSWNGQNVGIYINQVNGTTINNCNVSGFVSGINVSDGDYNIISGNTVHANDNGIGIFRSSNNIISGNTVHANDRGIGISQSSNNIISGNTVDANNDYGIELSWYNYDNNISGNTVTDSNRGIYFFYSTHNTIWNNNFSNNGWSNAYEDDSFDGNNWNLSNIGNYWDDFNASNSGYPNNYVIPGTGDGVDYYPVGGFSFTIISPENGTEYGLDQFLINISYSEAVDTIWYNTTNGIEYYEGPVYVNVSDIPWNWEWFGWPIYDSLKTYRLNVWVNSTLGFVDNDVVEFYSDLTPPNITIISPEDNTEFDTPGVLINISAWDNFGVDRINYSLRDASFNYEDIVFWDETYTEPFSVNLPNGDYYLTAEANDTSGISVVNSVSFTINAEGPEVIFHSPMENEIYQSPQVLVNLSASGDFVDTIWYNYTGWDNGEINSSGIYEGAVYQTFGPGPNYFTACVNDTAGNTNCESFYFEVWLPDLSLYSYSVDDFVNDGGDLNTFVNNINYFPYNPEAGEEINFEVIIRNSGSSSVNNFNYSYNFDYEERNLIVESFNGRGLDPGENVSITFNHTYDTAGNYTFYFEVDPEDYVEESSELNNVGFKSYFINGTPDLYPTLTSIEIDNENPNLAIFNIDINNIGDIWVDEFNYNIEFGDDQGSLVYITETIMPGESYILTLYHEYVTAGDYEVSFVLDPQNSIDEINESNNFFEATITILEETCISGDVNGDGTINVLDITNLVNILLGETNPTEAESCAADFNSDGDINVLDVVMMVDIILGG